MDLEHNDLVLCTVERIEKTIVFVKVVVGNEEVDGSIIMSEIAPGRIRNIRDYVVLKKKIVCKILRVSPNGNIELSLRRVSQKERKEFIERSKQEKNYISLIKNIFKDKAEKFIDKITKEESLYDFFEASREDQKNLEKVFGKDSKKILDVLKTQKQRTYTLTKNIEIKSFKPNGIDLIKEMIGKLKVKVSYISAGKYRLSAEASDPKSADKIIIGAINDMEKSSKSIGIEVSIKEK